MARDVTRRDLLRVGFGLAAGTAALSVARTGGGAGPARAASARGAVELADVAPAASVTRPMPTVRTAVRHRTHWAGPVLSIGDFQRHDPRWRPGPRAIMLTVDDGPDPVWTPRYLALFERHRVRATFCMIGSQVRQHRSLAKEVAAHGHRIANHTFTHDEGLTYRAPSVIASEIDRTNTAIHVATGHVPTLFRAPGGVWGPALLHALDQRGMTPLGWDVDPRDWAMPGTTAIADAMLASRPHDIILCHDGGGDRSQTYAALRTVVPALLHRGFTFTTLPV